MRNRCKANPCCGEPYACEVPLPQHESGLPNLNERKPSPSEGRRGVSVDASEAEEGSK